MDIIFISGKAEHGKDTLAKMMKEHIESKGKKAVITHYADLLKYICRQYFGWDGSKDEAGRTLLQYVGTDVVRKKSPHYWVDTLLEMFHIFQGEPETREFVKVLGKKGGEWVVTPETKDEWDFIIVADCRFESEVDTDYAKRVWGYKNAYHFRITRDDFENSLTEEQRAHISETELDKIKPDFGVKNNGTLEDLKQKTIVLLDNNVL